MSSISRRDAMISLAAGGTSLSLNHLLAQSTHAQNPPDIVALEETPANSSGPFRGQHQPRPLSFDPTKLQGLSEKLILSHWKNNYGGSVKALNEVELKLNALLGDQDTPAFLYGDLKREELNRTGSVVLHEFYFGNLGGNGQAGGEILAKLTEDFGSFELWQSEFIKTAKSLAGGSGWTILGYNFHTRELHNYWASDHMHNATASYPLLVLDMYEHSYHMDYGAAAAQYIDAFLQNVDWEIVNKHWLQTQSFGNTAFS